VYEDPVGRAAYQNGQYHLEVQAASTHLAALLPPNFRIPQNVRILVEAMSAPAQSSDGDYFGVICRYQDAYNYYFLVISQDGYYGIGKMKAGQAALLIGEQLLPTEVIQREGKNLIDAECSGSMIRLTVNGAQLGLVQDAEWQSGGVGLLAASGPNGPQLVEFDRLLVQVVRE
jgi:hypothetical protein